MFLLQSPAWMLSFEKLELRIPRKPVQREDILAKWNQFPGDPSVELPGVPKVYTSWTRERAKTARTSWNAEVCERETAGPLVMCTPSKNWHGMNMNQWSFWSRALFLTVAKPQCRGVSLRLLTTDCICFLHCSYRRTLSLCKWFKCPGPMVHEVKSHLKPCKSKLQVQTSSMNHATFWSQNRTHSHSWCQRSPTINNRGVITCQILLYPVSTRRAAFHAL